MRDICKVINKITTALARESGRKPLIDSLNRISFDSAYLAPEQQKPMWVRLNVLLSETFADDDSDLGNYISEIVRDV